MYSIAFIDNAQLLRSLVAQLLEKRFSCIVYQYGNGKEFIDRLPEENYLPSMVVLDIAMPVMNGFETIKWLKKNLPNVPVLVMSLIAKEEAIVKMLHAGMNGFITKNIQPDILYEAVDTVVNGGLYYYTSKDYRISNKTLYLKGRKVQPAQEPLTAKEEEMLKLISNDLGYQEIADRTNISLRTLETHKANISRKLKIETRRGLVLYALQMGMINVH